ncbi:MAG: hypothetical protein ABIN91_11410 [Mucilaginibacter sp.]|uniref:hypothetical protein n=1 Tax=Mucilaginibacter sp. TaxID=1882438 RepID=UPI0032644977
MSTEQLRNLVIDQISQIDDEQLLNTVYDLLKLKDNEQTGKIWASLSQEEKDEVLLSYEESEDENNLIEVSALFKKDK